MANSGLHNHKWPNTGPLAIFMPRHALICLDLASEGGFTTGERQLGPGQKIYSAKDIAFETKYKTPVLQMLYVPCYSFLGKHPFKGPASWNHIGSLISMHLLINLSLGPVGRQGFSSQYQSRYLYLAVKRETANLSSSCLGALHFLVSSLLPFSTSSSATAEH